MALMAVQAVSTVITPTFSTPTVSDTITPQPNQWLHIKIGGTATTVTIVIPGNQFYSGTATTDLATGSVSNTDRIFYLPSSLADPTTGLITVTYSQVTAVTAGLFRI